MADTVFLVAVLMRGNEVLLVREPHGLHHLPLLEAEKPDPEALGRALVEQTGWEGDFREDLGEWEMGDRQALFYLFGTPRQSENETERPAVWVDAEVARGFVHWPDSRAIRKATGVDELSA